MQGAGGAGAPAEVAGMEDGSDGDRGVGFQDGGRDPKQPGAGGGVTLERFDAAVRMHLRLFLQVPTRRRLRPSAMGALELESGSPTSAWEGRRRLGPRPRPPAPATPAPKTNIWRPAGVQWDTPRLP